MKEWFKFQGLVIIFLLMNCTNSANNKQTIEDAGKQSLTVLQDVLQQQEEWVKVHAAEFLLWTDHPENVKEVYLSELDQFGDKSQYRIGIWRVLAQAADNEEEKKQWTDKILGAFLDESGNDRIHAAETLAKLGISPLLVSEEVTRRAIESTVKGLSIYTQWSIAYTSAELKDSVTHSMINYVLAEDEDIAVKKQAAYVLRQLGDLSVEQWNSLAPTATQILDNNTGNLNLLSALFMHAPESVKDKEIYKEVHRLLVNFKTSDSKSERSEMIMALAKGGTGQDLPILLDLLSGKPLLVAEADNEDVKASAAYGILIFKDRH